jgi:hypothetical protein
VEDSGRIAGRSDDAALMGRVTMVLTGLDPAPPSLEGNARRLLSWRTVDAELAELVRDGPAATTD